MSADLLTVGQVAEMLNIQPRSVIAAATTYHRIRAANGRGMGLMFARDEIERYIRRRDSYRSRSLRMFGAPACETDQ